MLALANRCVSPPPAFGFLGLDWSAAPLLFIRTQVAPHSVVRDVADLLILDGLHRFYQTFVVINTKRRIGIFRDLFFKLKVNSVLFSQRSMYYVWYIADPICYSRGSERFDRR